MIGIPVGVTMLIFQIEAAILVGYLHSYSIAHQSNPSECRFAPDERSLQHQCRSDSRRRRCHG